MLGGIFLLMWEILHSCRESGRNSVQAGDSLSMRESWKPWILSIVERKFNTQNPIEDCFHCRKKV